VSSEGLDAEGISKLVAARKAKFLLLAGDVDRVPTVVRKAGYVSERFASDPDLATDGLFGAMAGRFPADSADELKVMVEKTLAYEAAPSGPWQRRIRFLAGEGGFGDAIDAVIERQFSVLVADAIPAGYEVETAYSKPSSRYFAWAPRFNENALRMLNDGSLFYCYVGHGLRTAMDDLFYQGKVYPTLSTRDAAKVDVREGLPIVVSIACNTGEFDSRLGDSVGEEFFKRPRGPVAFVGGTRVTQPYGNALIGNHLIRQVFHSKQATIGEALAAAREGVLARDTSALRMQADALAALVQGPGNLEPMRKDVVLHYNLLGDPATAIRRPDDSLTIEALSPPKPGAALEVRGTAKGAERVVVTLEVTRDRFWKATDLDGGDLEAAVAKRYRDANDKVVSKVEVGVFDGAFDATLPFPAEAKPGRYVIKVAVGGALGWRLLDVAE
jgi:Peptidase family C25